ncbi:MAG TPA: YbjQ family protein [Herpetosiphonaceae bacterium]
MTNPEYASQQPAGAAPAQLALDPRNITNAFELPGMRITRNLGVVRGIVVRSRSVFGTIGASLQTLVGGDITLWSEMCEQAREQAFQQLALHAAQRGANAIIAMRYDANEISAGVTEVLAYGTAVIVEPAG